MALTVGADSYVTIEDAQTYAGLVGASFAGSTPNMEAALRRATVWVDASFRSRFPGVKASGRDQVLEWPRAGATDAEGQPIPSDEIPVEVVNATVEAAIRELREPNSLSPDVVPGRAKTLVQVEGIRWEASPVAGGVEAERPHLTVVEGILSGLLKGGAQSTSRILRS